jgi:hypothetical protein
MCLCFSVFVCMYVSFAYISCECVCESVSLSLSLDGLSLSLSIASLSLSLEFLYVHLLGRCVHLCVCARFTGSLSLSLSLWLSGSLALSILAMPLRHTCISLTFLHCRYVRHPGYFGWYWWTIGNQVHARSQQIHVALHSLSLSSLCLSVCLSLSFLCSLCLLYVS